MLRHLIAILRPRPRPATAPREATHARGYVVSSNIPGTVSVVIDRRVLNR